MDCRGRAGGEGAGRGDVGWAVRAEGGEHGGGLVAGLGAVGAGVCASVWNFGKGMVCLRALPLHQAGGQEVRVRCRGAHAAVGGLHDCGEDEAAVDASRVGYVDDRFVDRSGFVLGVAGDFPGVAGCVDYFLVGSEPWNCQLAFSKPSPHVLTCRRRRASQTRLAILQPRCRYRCNSCKPLRRLVSV